MKTNNMTAVEWLVKELELEGYDYTIAKAINIEREQLEDAFQDGKWNGYENAKDISEIKDPSDYYNERYGKDSEERLG